jgi:hypothetical protein
VRKKGYELLVRLEETHEARVSEFRQSMGVDTDMRFVNRMRTTPTAVALKLIPETTLSIIKSAAISFVNMLQEIVDNGPEEHIGIHQWFVEQESILLEYISLYLDGQDEAAIKVLQDELSRRD